jgi:hypothetical protein
VTSWASGRWRSAMSPARRASMVGGRKGGGGKVDVAGFDHRADHADQAMRCRRWGWSRVTP